MVVILRWCVCLFLVWNGAVQAEENASKLPDPVALEVNWWGYFEPTEEIDNAELLSRIEKTRDRLAQSSKGLAADQLNILMPMVNKINDGLQQYASLRDSTTSERPPLSPALDKYTVSAALERFVLWRKLKRELDLEDGDLVWQKAQLSLERKRQSQLRNDYLQLAVTDAQRLSQGLTLMASRISIELSALQTKRRDTKLKNASLQVAHLGDELAIIHQRMVPSKEGDEWLKQQTSVKSKTNTLRKQTGASVGDQSPDTPLGSANIKYLLLQVAATDIQVSILELAELRYGAMVALEQLIVTQRENDAELLANTLKKFVEHKQLTREQQQSWRSLTEQTRKFISAQNINNDQSDAALNKAYKRLLKQLDENERWLRDFELEQDVGGFLVTLAQEKLKDNVGWFEQWWLVTKSSVEKSWSQVSVIINATLFEINEVPVTTLGLVSVLFIVSIALLISKILRHGLDKLGRRKAGANSSAFYTLGRVVHYIIMIVGIIAGLSSIGIDFTKFALFASALGVGIGFGLQAIIGNFVAGLIILFERSLKVGDFVELPSGLVGEVREINMRSTLITTNDNVDILVPNSDLVNNQVTNWTLRDTQRRIRVPFGVAYGTEKELVKQATLEAADEVKWTLRNSKHRHPQVWFVEFGDSSLNFELVVWLTPEAVKRPSAVQAAYLWEIDTKLREYNIEIPFPQRDLHLRSLFGQKDEAGLALINNRMQQEL